MLRNGLRFPRYKGENEDQKSMDLINELGEKQELFEAFQSLLVTGTFL